MPQQLTFETTERQKKYVESQEASGEPLGIVFADAFIRGMRDIGYKGNGWALAELVDNSVQAGAKTVAVNFGYTKGTKSNVKPDMLAVVDDGVGMIPRMLSYAVRWGGTDRENDRKGFGRYGYGLPSAAVSMAKRYTVYSKVQGEDWHAVTVDLEELAPVAHQQDKLNEVLRPKQANPPAWVMGTKGTPDVGKIESGTVIVLETLDRLEWKKTETLKSKLMQLLGVIYRHWLPTPKLIVDGDAVKPVDPLFLMEQGMFFDENDVRAERVDTRAFNVENGAGRVGTVRVRASYLPPNFQSVDPHRYTPDRRGNKVNKRHSVMKEYNGLLVCRDGRQIDCIQPRFTKFQTYDYNTKVEIDFEPELDEFFGITTSKQQIVISDFMWDKIEQSGRVRDLIKDIRSKFKGESDHLKGESQNQEDPDEPRPSETAMMESEKFKTQREPVNEQKKAEAKQNLEREADRQARDTDKPREEVVKQLETEAAERRYRVAFEASREGPFYRVERFGEQKRVWVNTDHPFYPKLFDISPDVSAAMEVLLLVLGEAELEADGEAEVFYKAQRSRWSDRLRHALDSLSTDDAVRDRMSAAAERLDADLAA